MPLVACAAQGAYKALVNPARRVSLVARLLLVGPVLLDPGYALARVVSGLLFWKPLAGARVACSWAFNGSCLAGPLQGPRQASLPSLLASGTPLFMLYTEHVEGASRLGCTATPWPWAVVIVEYVAWAHVHGIMGAPGATDPTEAPGRGAATLLCCHATAPLRVGKVLV